MRTREIVAKLSDWHVPFHDPAALNVAFQFVKLLKPLFIVIDEVLDWYQLSRFDKEPRRVLEFDADLEQARDSLADLRRAAPESTIVMVRSNHDQRLERYKRLHPELSSLDALTLPNLLALRKHKIRYADDFQFRNVLFKHGSIIRKHSGYTARAELEREGCSGVSGHSHRLGIHFVSLRGGKYCWIEGGCLCKTDKVEYIDGTANWQQGVTLYSFKSGSSHFHPAIYPIIENQIIFGEKTLEAKS